MKYYGIFRILLLLVVAMNLLSGCKEKPEENEEERWERVRKEYFELAKIRLDSFQDQINDKNNSNFSEALSQYRITSGRFISQDSARIAYCLWRERYKEPVNYNDTEDPVEGVLFGADYIRKMLDTATYKGVEGLRFYFAIFPTERGEYYRNLVVIPTDSLGNDLIPIRNNSVRVPLRALNGSMPCPDACGNNNDYESCP